MKTFYINSNNRLSGTNSNFTHRIDVPKNAQYTKACIIAASIPKSYYLIQAGLNSFTLSENTDVTVSISIGNYSRKSLRDELISKLNSASPGGWSYSVSFPPNTEVDQGKFTFSVTGNSIQPSLVFSSAKTGLHQQLGFNRGSTNTFSGDTLISTNVINLQRESTLFIHSNLCSTGTDDIIQEIYTKGETFSQISFENPNVEYYSKPITTTNTNTISIQLTDEDGTLIDLNGINMVLTILMF